MAGPSQRMLHGDTPLTQLSDWCLADISPAEDQIVGGSPRYTAARCDLLERCQDFCASSQDFLEVGMQITKAVVGQFEPLVISAAELDSLSQA